MCLKILIRGIALPKIYTCMNKPVMWLGLCNKSKNVFVHKVDMIKNVLVCLNGCTGGRNGSTN